MLRLCLPPPLTSHAHENHNRMHPSTPHHHPAYLYRTHSIARSKPTWLCATAASPPPGEPFFTHPPLPLRSLSTSLRPNHHSPANSTSAKSNSYQQWSQLTPQVTQLLTLQQMLTMLVLLQLPLLILSPASNSTNPISHSFHTHMHTQVQTLLETTPSSSSSNNKPHFPHMHLLTPTFVIHLDAQVMATKRRRRRPRSLLTRSKSSGGSGS